MTRIEFCERCGRSCDVQLCSECQVALTYEEKIEELEAELAVLKVKHETAKEVLRDCRIVMGALVHWSQSLAVVNTLKEDIERIDEVLND